MVVQKTRLLRSSEEFCARASRSTMVSIGEVAYPTSATRSRILLCQSRYDSD